MLPNSCHMENTKLGRCKHWEGFRISSKTMNKTMLFCFAVNYIQNINNNSENVGLKSRSFSTTMYEQLLNFVQARESNISQLTTTENSCCLREHSRSLSNHDHKYVAFLTLESSFCFTKAPLAAVKTSFIKMNM